MLEVLEDPFLKKIEIVGHGFFTREGGVSLGVHGSLNCAYPTSDNSDNVRENRRLAMSYFGYPLESLASVRNVHGNTVVVVDKLWDENQKPLADGMVTKKAGIILGSDSADCPIVLFADEQAKVIGLAHAGWRGAIKGVIEATVEQMVSIGATHEHISAAISPCIAQNSYEVSLEFFEQFIDQDVGNKSYFTNSTKANHFLFDLLGYVKNRLYRVNVKVVSSEVAFDTYSDERRFYSCRRATHRAEKCFGGQLSCIYLK
ncbi:MAG: peptidoglycan editing factor PgeF [Chlamydiae bacterium]|nr:peptidoglycan editing factor PgeF [Chlamydiota bacterium]